MTCTDMVTIYNKIGGQFKLLIPGAFTFINIIIDSIDSALDCNYFVIKI